MTIKAHFDGKVFVPDEPVKLEVGHTVLVDTTDLPSGKTTGRELFEYLQANPQLKEIWDGIAAGRTSQQLARDLREQAQTPRRFSE